MASDDSRSLAKRNQPTTTAELKKVSLLGAAGMGFGAGGFAFAAAAGGHWWTLIPAVLLGAGSLVTAIMPRFLDSLVLLEHQTVGGGQIGLGATVDTSARIESGARVEMGSTVGARATIQSGAVVGMGSTVQEDAVVEEDAVIGWGATVGAGARVGRGARIGAGSTVRAHAVVPAQARISAGGTVGSHAGDQAPAALPTPVDPRDVRLDVLCDRIEAELTGVSQGVDQYLGAPRETIRTVRRTSHDLLTRERKLRALVDPAEKARLDREKASLDARIASETDPVTRQRLQGAVDAIADHRRQHEVAERDAGRFEAEQTRLAWTLEGLLANVIRLRTSDTAGAPAELDRGLTQLREDVSAIASALIDEQTADATSLAGGPPEPVADSPTQPSRVRIY